MSEPLSIGYLVKRYIEMRGWTIKKVADAVGKNYTTFCGILKRDAIDAKLLFELSNLLDMDLAWMSQLFSHNKSISSLDQYQMPRMQEDFRELDYPTVCQQLDYCIQNNPNSISETRKELLSIYPSLFYVLDILLPVEYIIRITVERGKEKFYCIPLCEQTGNIYRTRGRTTQQIYEGNELLNQIIARRKEELK